MHRFFADRQSRACDSTSQALLFLCLSSRYGQKSNIKRRRITFGNACNTLANAKTLFFACKIVANAKTYFFSFARLLQTPKRFFFACKIVASAKKYFSPFARLLQAPKSTFPHLQDCCKRQKVLFPICKIVASAANYFFPFARVLQAFPKTDRPLQKGMNSGKQRLAELPQAFIESGSGRMDLGAFLPPLWEMNSRQRSRDDGFFSSGWCTYS